MAAAQENSVARGRCAPGRRPTLAIAVAMVILVAVVAGVVYKVLSPGATPPPNATTLIQQGADRLQNSRSFHFTYDVAGAAASSSGSGSSLIIQGASGDFVRPSSLAATIQAATSSGALSTQIIELNGKTYLLNPVTSAWSVAQGGFDPSTIFDPSTGIKRMLSELRNISSDGEETVDGRPAWRVKATVPGAALALLVGSTPQVAAVPIQGWIAKDDRRIIQLRATGALVSGESTTTARTLTLSGYDKAYTIKAPALQ